MRSAVVDLATQPSRNLAVNPTFEVIMNNIGTANGASMVRDTSAAIRGAYGVRVTCPINAIADSGVGLMSQVSPLVPGRAYTYSVYVRAVTAGRVNMYLTGRTGGDSARIWTPTLAAGQTYRLSATYTAASGTSGDWWLLRDDGNVQSIFDVDAVMVTEGSKLQPYGDGDAPGWRWTGTAHASESVGHPFPDIRQLSLRTGPVYNDLTAPAGIYSVPAYTGPTGTPVGRMSTTGNPLGWGAYLAASLPGLLIPAGTPIKITWYERGTGNGFNYEIVSDDAQNRAGGTWAVSAPDPVNWTARSVTSTTFVDWNPAFQKFRVAANSGGWVEMSDVKLRVG